MNERSVPQPEGRLEALWVKRYRGGPMDWADRAVVRAGQGIDGNADQGRKRQVTLLQRETWERVTAPLGRSIDPSLRRANLIVSGVSLVDARGEFLQVGDVRIRIYGETKPCRLMDEAAPGLQAALREPWAGGAFGEVYDDGEIHVGDPVRFLPVPERDG